MDDEPVHLSPGDATAEEILDRLEDGDRVVLEREFLGSVHEVTLRFEDGIYYCDTPTTLHRHESAEDMRRCLDEQRYGSG